MEKRLYRIEDGKKVAGVCGEIAEYFNVDPTLIRLLWVMLFFMAGTGLLAYFVAALIMPSKSDVM